MNVFKKTVLVATAALVLGFGANAQASVITGDISFGGTLDPALVLGTTTEVRFSNPALVTFVNGDFASNGVTFGEQATFNDFTFSPGFVANNPLWTIHSGDFSFALGAITHIDQAAGHLSFRGEGILSSTIAGLEDSAYTWSFSADTTNTVAFSATNAPNAVPEPGTMLLMGSGLLGLGLWRRFKK